MDFRFSPEQKAIQELAQNFADQDLAPHAAEWDRTSFFPVETFKKAATLGFGGIYVSPNLGGCGLGRLEGALIFEALSQGCVSSAAYLSIHNMVAWMIDQFGTDSQKSEILPKVTTCETLTSYSLTEPGAGSDAASLTTSAEKKGDTYVLNGRKTFISGAGVSDLYAVMARTGEEGPKGITCFLVEKETPGLSFGAPEHKMGWKSQPTADVTFDNCIIPESQRLGAEGQGFKIAMAALDGGRINIASCSLGGARSALARSLHYTQERKQFGKSLNQFQALQFPLRL